MKINKLALTSLPKFIKLNFGKEGYKKWLESISPEAKKIYTNKKTEEWYDLKSILLDPLQVMCNLFYDGDLFGAEEVGIFEVENTLNSMIKFFIKLGSPEFIIKKSNILFKKYYKDIYTEIIYLEKKKAKIRIHNFKKMEEINKRIIIGWIIKILKLCGAQKIQINVEQKNINKKNIIDFFGTFE